MRYKLLLKANALFRNSEKFNKCRVILYVIWFEILKLLDHWTIRITPFALHWFLNGEKRIFNEHNRRKKIWKVIGFVCLLEYDFKKKNQLEIPCFYLYRIFMHAAYWKCIIILNVLVRVPLLSSELFFYIFYSILLIWWKTNYSTFMKWNSRESSRQI